MYTLLKMYDLKKLLLNIVIYDIIIDIFNCVFQVNKCIFVKRYSVVRCHEQRFSKLVNA